jgi:F-type H+-transporting ATPase subunit c
MKSVGISIVMVLCCTLPAFAQTSPTSVPPPGPETAAGTSPSSVSLSGKGIAAGLGMGLALIGAGIGFGMIGRAAMDAMARQPEVAPRVQTGMLIIAAMLEGAALAAVVLSFVVGNSAPF